MPVPGSFSFHAISIQSSIKIPFNSQVATFYTKEPSRKPLLIFHCLHVYCITIHYHINSIVFCLIPILRLRDNNFYGIFDICIEKEGTLQGTVVASHHFLTFILLGSLSFLH